MNRYYVLFVACFAVFNTVTVTGASDQQQIQSVNYHGFTYVAHGEDRKLLRTATLYDTDTEERGVISSIKSLVLKAKYSRKTTRWAKTEESDDIVKEALGLKGLSEAAMKKKPKYEVYQQYLHKVEGAKMDQMANKRILPQKVWNDLELEKMTAAERKGSDAYRQYVRYSRKFDNMAQSSRIQHPVYGSSAALR